MNFDISKADAHTTIKVNVEKLDSQFAPELKSHIIMANKSGETNLIIDLASTKYCDSSGLSALLVANRLCRDGGGMLVVSSLQDPVMKLVTISQLHNVLNISPSIAEAEELIAAGDTEE
jgi:anti-anti-sigma factor